VSACVRACVSACRPADGPASTARGAAAGALGVAVPAAGALGIKNTMIERSERQQKATLDRRDHGNN
jgi:hypothetical protein